MLSQHYLQVHCPPLPSFCAQQHGHEGLFPSCTHTLPQPVPCCAVVSARCQQYLCFNFFLCFHLVLLACKHWAGVAVLGGACEGSNSASVRAQAGQSRGGKLCWGGSWPGTAAQWLWLGQLDTGRQPLQQMGRGGGSQKTRCV